MVTYDFYVNVYHGSAISADNWDTMERDASAKLEQYKRKYTVTAPGENSEALAVCAIAETMDYYEVLENGNIAVQAASIGSVSVTYDNSAKSVEISPKVKEKELYRAARMYLDIYRGVGE
jgi:hypothetical protein